MQKAREGKWNGGFAPYGYKLVDGKLHINEEEAEAIRIIFGQYVNTDIGAKVALMTLDEKYLPTAIVLPFEGHARQSKLMHAQVNTTDEKYLDLWIQIVKQKISNQSRALSIMGLEGAEKIAKYVATVNEESLHMCYIMHVLLMV